METVRIYVVDLSEISGEGEFECPKCKALISPDDHSERAYSILETVMNGDFLEKIVIQCNNCRSQILIVGFKRITVERPQHPSFFDEWQHAYT